MKLQTIAACQRRQNSRLRRELTAQGPELFGQIYLRDRFKYRMSRMHVDLFALLQSASAERGRKLAIAAPRAHAKTTIVSEVYVLWSIFFEKEQYIWIVSDTADQAMIVLNNIKRELEDNAILREDFPHVCEDPKRRPVPRRWRKNEIDTRNGIAVAAMGAGTKQRGRKHRTFRPSLIVLDDIENDEEVRSAEQRQHRKQWFTKTILHAGTAETNFIVIGTILHFDSLLAGLMDPKQSPDWTGRMFKAVERFPDRMDLWDEFGQIFCRAGEFEGASGIEGAQAFYEYHREAMGQGSEVLWPGNPGESLLPLMKLRYGSPRAFDSEKQNVPVNPDDCYFSRDDFRYWDDEFATVEAHLKRYRAGTYRIVGACDPSLGKKDGDYSTLILLGQERATGLVDVLVADIKRRRIDELIQTILGYARIHRIERFAFESNQFQVLALNQLKSALQKARVSIGMIEEVSNSGDKMARIQTLEPFIKSGTLRFSRKSTLLQDQLAEFPMGRHDDGPDALEMAMRLTTKFRNKGIIFGTRRF